MYNPLPQQLKIKNSPIHGSGLFATTEIPEGTILGISHILHDLFPDGWIRTPLGGFYNHSITPNCELIVGTLESVPHYGTSTRLLKTIVDIKEDEELTCTYSLWQKEDVAIGCVIQIKIVEFKGGGND